MAKNVIEIENVCSLLLPQNVGLAVAHLSNRTGLTRFRFLLTTVYEYDCLLPCSLKLVTLGNVILKCVCRRLCIIIQAFTR